MTIIIPILYICAMLYSLFCAPGVWFRIFRFRHGPEYAMAYLVGCIFLGLSLLGAVLRIGFLIADRIKGE